MSLLTSSKICSTLASIISTIFELFTILSPSLTVFKTTSLSLSIYDFKVFGNTYAYLKNEIITEKNMIFEMHYTMINDWKKIRPDIKTIYIFPQDLEMAKQKVQEREMSIPKLKERISEMTKQYNEVCKDKNLQAMFDYIVYNNYDKESEKEITEIVKTMLNEK